MFTSIIQELLGRKVALSHKLFIKIIEDDDDEHNTAIQVLKKS